MYNEFIKLVERKEYKPKLNKIKSTTYFRCLYCNVEYDTKEKAQACIDKHELVLVPISRNDLNRLQTFLLSKDEKLLTPSLVNIISRYVRELARK